MKDNEWNILCFRIKSQKLQLMGAAFHLTIFILSFSFIGHL
jgi:hypothetical protein